MTQTTTPTEMASTRSLTRNGLRRPGLDHQHAATEVVNSTDDDCNGLIDDGTSAMMTTAMAIPKTGDCDDDDVLAVPGGTEICGDGIDNDCVGGDDTCGLLGSYDISDFGDELFGPNLNDYFGLEVAVADFDGDGVEELASVSDWSPSYGYVWSEAPTGSAAADADSWVHLPKCLRLQSTYSGPMSPGDVNGDGYADLLTGCPWTTSNGITYLVLGPLTGGGDISALAASTTLGENWSPRPTSTSW